MNLSIGPEIGGISPVGGNSNSWETSVLFGPIARYELPSLDIDAGFGFSELALPSDSAHYFDYQLYAISAGVSRNYHGFRYGIGGSVFSFNGSTLVDSSYALSRIGTEYGGYIQLGREFVLDAGVAGVSARLIVVDSEIKWLTVSSSFLLDLTQGSESD